jgi:Family of unknown function (DUF6498)
MSNAEPRINRQISPADWLRAFAASRASWLVLARNLIPVVGVFAFDWSLALTTFNYWFDGITAMGALLAAVLARALVQARKTTQNSTLRLVLVLAVVWLIVFGLFGIPYWLLLDSVPGVLQLPVIAMQIEESPMLLLTFAAVAVGNFSRPFASGFLTMSEDQLKQRGGSEFGALIARAVAMSLIARIGMIVVLVPAMALLLTYLEVKPDLDRRMLENHQARQKK